MKNIVYGQSSPTYITISNVYNSNDVCPARYVTYSLYEVLSDGSDSFIKSQGNYSTGTQFSITANEVGAYLETKFFRVKADVGGTGVGSYNQWSPTFTIDFQ